MAEKKKSTPKTSFEKIGAAYESEARRQEKSGNTEMATKTRKAAAKSMTPENKKALEEDTQKAKESKMAKKKTTAKKKGASKKVDAVEAAGAKAQDAVGKAKERNPIGTPASKGDKQGTPKPSSRLTPPIGYGDYSDPKTAEGQRAADREFDKREYENKNSDRPKFGSVAEQREKNPPPGNPGYKFGSVAEQREKAGPVKPSKLRAGAEGTSGKSGPAFRQNDITTEMPETRREKDEARTARIKELATSGVSKDPSDKGEMPSNPTPRSKPTVMVTPTKDGKMPKSDKPGFMSRLRSRMGSFSSRPGASAGAGAPPTPPAGGGGYAPTPPPTPPASKQAGQAYGDVNTGTMNDYSINKRSTDSNVSVGGDMNIGNVHNQNLKNSGGGITATTSGKARSTKAGITASTTGSATSSHPRAQNASRGGRPTNRKK